MDRWTEVETFIKTVELGSISKAAADLGLSVAAASRHLAGLEQRLGARLVERNTRRQYLTEIGEHFYQRCKESHTILMEAESVVGVENDALDGTLSVSASVTFCVRHLAEMASRFSQQYPGLAVRILVDNHYSDLIADNIDVAIRTRQYEPDSNIVVRRLAESRVILSATPAYLARHGAPDTPAALNAHRLLVYSYASSVAAWTFTRDGERIEVAARPTFEANDGLTLRSAALSDAGILFQPYYCVFDDIAAGRLVPVLPEWDLPHLVCNVAYRNRRFVPGKVRRFVGFIEAGFDELARQGRWIV